MKSLPDLLVGADWRRYAGRHQLPLTWDGFARMWWNIGYVRLQAFERESDARLEALGHE